MVHTPHRANRIGLAGFLALFGTLAGLVLWSGNGKGGYLALGPRAGGEARLVSIQPLPETSGPMCEMVPASASSSLFAELRQQQEPSEPAAAEPRPSDSAREAGAKRQPVRMIKDPGAAFSAVALDLAHDEVVLQDENNFSIMTYNRLENTPAFGNLAWPTSAV